MPSHILKAKDLGLVLPLVVGDMNEWGATAISIGSTSPRSLLKSANPFFLHIIYVGLVPPFSDFFYAILSHYEIRVLHLQPNSILLLVVFAFHFEAFVGVRPLVVLFFHFFSLRFTAQGQHSTYISFVDVAGAGTRLKAGKKVDGYRNHWVFMDTR
ncbi:retrotransposon unclassified [Hordeum vulgare]|nr:retrotransposon unclassified [Hordeum vulgare]